MYSPGKDTQFIVDDELVRLFRHMEHLDAEGLENYVILLVIRLQSVPVYVGVTETDKQFMKSASPSPAITMVWLKWSGNMQSY